MKYYAPLFIILITILHAPDDYWWSKWTVMLVLSGIWVGYYVWKRFHWTMGMAVAWSIFSGAYTFSWRYGLYSKMSYQHLLGIHRSSMFAVICLLLLVIIFLKFKNRWIKPVDYTLAGMCIINSIYVIGQYLLLENRYVPQNGAAMMGGFFDNASINACLIAITTPFILNLPLRRTYLLIGFPLLACVMSESSVAVAAMALCSVVMLWPRVHVRLALKVVVLLVSLSIIILSGYLIIGDEMFNDSGRFKMWKIAIGWWWKGSLSGEPVPYLLGTGIGTGHELFRVLQVKTKFLDVGGYYLWLHNDWLQCLFEQGLGFILYVMAYVYAIIKGVVNRKHEAVAAGITYGFVAVFNYPVHLAMHAFVGGYIMFNLLNNPRRMIWQSK